MTMPHFMGYAQMEAWARVTDAQQPIYALLTTETGSVSSLGARTDRSIIMVAQPDAAQNVHYCRLLVGHISYVHERPFEPDHQERRQQAHQAWAIVQEWLAEQGFTVRTATLARPRDLVLVEGSADFLQWDAETQQFCRAAPIP